MPTRKNTKINYIIKQLNIDEVTLIWHSYIKTMQSVTLVFVI